MKYLKRGMQIFLMTGLLVGVSSCEKPPVSTDNDYSPTVRSKVDDSVITAKVKAALFNNEAIRSLNVSVVTNEGLVTLTGVVDQPGQIETSSALAMKVDGVKSVRNRLTVKKVEPAQPGTPAD